MKERERGQERRIKRGGERAEEKASEWERVGVSEREGKVEREGQR